MLVNECCLFRRASSAPFYVSGSMQPNSRAEHMESSHDLVRQGFNDPALSLEETAMAGTLWNRPICRFVARPCGNMVAREGGDSSGLRESRSGS